MSAALLFEKVSNGLLPPEWYSNLVEHLKWSFLQTQFTGRTPEQFRKKIHLIFHLRGSEFDSDKHSDKEYIYLTIDILHMIYCVVKVTYKGRQFPDEFVSFLLLLFSN